MTLSHLTISVFPLKIHKLAISRILNDCYRQYILLIPDSVKLSTVKLLNIRKMQGSPTTGQLILSIYADLVEIVGSKVGVAKLYCEIWTIKSKLQAPPNLRVPG